MSGALLGLLGIFPVSFLAFVFSERLNVTHQARAGKAISFFDFLNQSWLDLIADLKSLPSRRTTLLYIAQLSGVGLIFINLNWAFYLYLLFNWILIVVSTHSQLEVFERLSSDRSQLRFILGALMAFLCVVGCGLSQGNLIVTSWNWHWTHLLFILPFQVAGMVMFGEHPFTTLYPRVYWLKSSRFFVWSLVSAQLFLGGSLFFLDFYIKATLIYAVSRLAGQYFPKYQQEDLFKISLIYFIPVTFMAFLLSAVVHV